VSPLAEDEALEADEPTSPARALRTLTVGFLGLVPLLCAYELGVRAEPNAERSTSELLVSLAFTPFGRASDDVRALALALGFVVMLAVAWRRRVPLGPALARTVLEGVAGALALGPLLLGLSLLLSGVLPTIEEGWAADAIRAPSLARAGRLVGGAAWEELLFRVGVYSALFLVTRGLASAAKARLAVGTWIAELVGLFGSALLFAAVHLDAAVSWLGVGGEPFDGAVFTWRTLAGVLLGLLFRWRGAGVAAWSHALFNLGIELGIGRQIIE